MIVQENKPGNQVLLELIRAVEDAEDVLGRKNLDESTRCEFQDWWDRRKQVSVRILHQKSLVDSRLDEQAQLRYGLGVYILDSGSQVGQVLPEDELVKCVDEFKRRLAVVLNDLGGYAKPSLPWRILTEQITDLWHLRGEVRELRNAIEHVLRRLPGNDKELKNFKQELSNKVENELDGLLDKLERLDIVVKNVCNHLPTAYQEHNAEAWKAIRQWFHGWEGLDEGKSRIPEDLQTHKTLNWIKAISNDLENKRNKLEHSVQEIIWCLNHETVEAKRPDLKSLPDTKSSEPTEAAWAKTKMLENWVKAKVSEDWITISVSSNWPKSGNSPIGVRSLLEDASEQLRWVIQHAEPTGYEYEIFISEKGKWVKENPVEGTTNYLIGQIKRQVSWPSGEDLEDNLGYRIDAINSLRKQLHPILGGRLPDSQTNSPPYKPWEHVCKEVMPLLREGDFEKAHRTCRDQLEEKHATDSTNTSLPSRTLKAAITYLESITEENLPGAMVSMLQEVARMYLEKLERDQEKVKELEQIVKQLEGEFNHAWDEFDYQLKRYEQLNTKGWLASIPFWGSQHRLKRDEVYTKATSALKYCFERCPNHKNIHGWMRLIQADQSPPDEAEWCKKFIPMCFVPNDSQKGEEGL